ncbi:hypothetical protein [uncultured Methanobrevibacter sp.]|uniref:hypothetical protein n=1 Tax=uncultured Methanobrevibacter sp. TaxID=253161 RepID=UPI0025FD288F|nr:hypothetical protein [uncultured Methanobrevibacter sp.]
MEGTVYCIYLKGCSTSMCTSISKCTVYCCGFSIYCSPFSFRWSFSSEEVNVFKYNIAIGYMENSCF